MANLNLNRIINITVNYAQAGARAGNYGTLLVLGDSPVLDNRLKYYTNSDAVLSDFGMNAPETKAAQAYFSQSPSPKDLYVGRWLNVVNPSKLVSYWPTLASDPVWAQLKATTGTGAFAVDVNGTKITVAGINLSNVTNVQTLFTAIDTAVKALTTPPITASLNAATGTITLTAANPTGAVKTGISFATPPATGVDFSTLLRLTQAAGATRSDYADGTETILDAVQACRVAAGDWYGLAFCPFTKTISEDDLVAVMDLVDSWESNVPAFFFAQSSNPALRNAASTVNLGTRVKEKKIRNSILNYASADPTLTQRLAGFQFATDYAAKNSIRDPANKSLVGAVPDTILQGEDSVLESRNVNYYANWGSAQTLTFYRKGILPSGQWIDEVIGLAWFRSALIAAGYNVFTTSQTKVPQTESGQALILNAFEQVCALAVKNGLAAPGVWRLEGFGSLKRGDTLPSGFYVWGEPMDKQSDADRGARVLPPVKIALTGAGSIQSIAANVVFQP